MDKNLADRSDLVPRIGHIENGAWKTIVRNMPIPSVDLLIKCPTGFLLGKRTNKPAKDEWFIPGGRIQKGEPLEEAVHRIAEEELGTEVSIDRSLGVYDHFYDTSDVPESGGKHYIAHAYLVLTSECTVTTDDQHSKFRVFETPPKDLHPHVEAYLEAAEFR